MKHFCFIVNNSTIYKENSGHHHDVRCPNTKTTIYEKNRITRFSLSESAPASYLRLRRNDYIVCL